MSSTPAPFSGADSRTAIAATEPHEATLAARRFATSCTLLATREQVFAALITPERLARWWGPAGFTNTSHVCEPWAGGRWLFTMHGPDGKAYANECRFAEVSPPHTLVITHVNEPLFRLSITLNAAPNTPLTDAPPAAAGAAAQTQVAWEQVFDSAQVAKAMAPIVKPANEQNLQRLSAEVARGLAS